MIFRQTPRAHKVGWVALLLTLVWLPSLSYALKFGTLADTDRELPAFEMLTMEDKVWTKVDFKDKLTIVNFWATWCAPCREEMPSLNRAWEKVKDQGVSMVAINLGETKDQIARFTNEIPIDFTVLRATDPSTMSNWQVRGLPTTLVVDERGRIIKEFIGPAEWDQDELLDPILDLL